MDVAVFDGFKETFDQILSIARPLRSIDLIPFPSKEFAQSRLTIRFPWPEQMISGAPFSALAL